MNPKYTYHAQVLGVYDGDSLTLNIDLGLHIWRMEKVRLLGINTPEIRGPERDRGLAVRDHVRFLMDEVGGDVVVTTHKDRTGKYGRLLAVVYYGDKYERNLNAELVELGMAVPYMV